MARIELTLHHTDFRSTHNTSEPKIDDLGAFWKGNISFGLLVYGQFELLVPQVSKREYG